MQWSSELNEVREQYIKIGKEVHESMYNSWYEKRFAVEAWEALAKTGFFEATLKHGPRKGIEWIGAAIQGFSFGSQDAAFNFATIAQAAMSVPLLSMFGGIRAKEKYLSRITSGEDVVAFCSTEAATGGTDAFNPGSNLKLENGRYLLNGQKWHITNAGYAPLFFVWCTDKTTNDVVCAIVERGFYGLTVGDDCSPCGGNTAPVASMRFDDIVVPEENIIRFEHGGKKALNQILIGERILAAFPALGVMEAALKKAIGFIKERKVNGVKLVDTQYKQNDIVQAQRCYNIVAALARMTLDGYISGASSRSEASELKITAVEYGAKAVSHCKDACGSYGLQEQAQFSMWLNDGLVAKSAGGTDEAHKTIVFAETLRRHKDTLPLWINKKKPWMGEDVVPAPVRLEKVSQLAY